MYVLTAEGLQVAGMNRRRLQFEGPISAYGDASTASGIGAAASSTDGPSSANDTPEVELRFTHVSFLV
jgi:hypothetical protein